MLLLNACELNKDTNSQIMEDCWHDIRIAVWQDLNGDGIWNASEPPLKGVKFDVVSGPVGEINGGPSISDKEGIYLMDIWHSSRCGNNSSETYSIIASSPDSYLPTTPNPVIFSGNIIQQVQFGFRPIFTMKECQHEIRISAWQDLDGDGIWGEFELPMPGAKFNIIGPFTEITSGYPLISNELGRLDVGIWHPGSCYDETYTLYVEPSDLYSTTTTSSIIFSFTPMETVIKFQFGFRSIPNEKEFIFID